MMLIRWNLREFCCTLEQARKGNYRAQDYDTGKVAQSHQLIASMPQSAPTLPRLKGSYVLRHRLYSFFFFLV